MRYKQSKRCQHPHHQPKISKKAPAPRSVPISRCISVAEKCSMLFLIGAVLCFNHMKSENEIDKDEPPGIYVTQDDPDYETPEPVIFDNILNSSETGVTDVSKILDMNPITFQISNFFKFLFIFVSSIP